MRAVDVRNDGVVVSSGFSFALIRTDRTEVLVLERLREDFGGTG